MFKQLMVALLVVLGSSGVAMAQTNYPSKPLHMVVPYPPGGSVDTAARAVSQKLAERLGQAVVVENRPGAAGMVGSDIAAKSPADGYTLVWGTVSSHAINMSLYSKVPYDNLRDFAPITQLLEQPLMIVVPLSSKIDSLQDLIRSLQTRSAAYNFGTAGAGTTGHLTGELLKKLTGGDLTHVAYKGSSPMLTDLLGGQIEMGIDNLPSALALVKGGKLRGLAITSATRSRLAPDIPTLSEAIPNLTVFAWQGLFAPAGTPAAILDRLFREIREILQDPALSTRLVDSGTFPATSNSREEFAAFVRQETLRWAEIVKASGAKAN
jgi:tripartite-type tricarboxylate transporter receptor subunit TctC